eukprot:scaffold1243_cov173-Ochromonas_danica.AAC.24
MTTGRVRSARQKQGGCINLPVGLVCLDWKGRVGVEVQSSGGVTASGGGRVIVAVEGHLQAAT